MNYLLLALLVATLISSQAFTGRFAGYSSKIITTSPSAAFHSEASPLFACRRNNKIEKRKRNRDYARKFQSKVGGSRKTVVIEQKRGIVAAAEEKFQSEVFKMTTDEDMPAYSGFDWSS